MALTPSDENGAALDVNKMDSEAGAETMAAEYEAAQVREVGKNEKLKNRLVQLAKEAGRRGYV